MAFSTQKTFLRLEPIERREKRRKLEGYDTGLKGYLSCLDGRAWSLDPNERNLYLAELVACPNFCSEDCTPDCLCHINRDISEHSLNHIKQNFAHVGGTPSSRRMYQKSIMDTQSIGPKAFLEPQSTRKGEAGSGRGDISSMLSENVEILQRTKSFKGDDAVFYKESRDPDSNKVIRIRRDEDGIPFKEAKRVDGSKGNRVIRDDDGIIFEDAKEPDSNKTYRIGQDDGALYKEARGPGRSKANRGRLDNDETIFKETRDPNSSKAYQSRQDDDGVVYKEARDPRRSKTTRGRLDDDGAIFKDAKDPGSSKAYQGTQDDDAVFYKEAREPRRSKAIRDRLGDDGIIFKDTKDPDSSKENRDRQDDGVYYKEARKSRSSKVYSGRQDDDVVLNKDAGSRDRSQANRGRQDDGILYKEVRDPERRNVNQGKQDDNGGFYKERRSVSQGRQDNVGGVYKEARDPGRRSVSRGRQDDDRVFHTEARDPGRSVSRGRQDDDRDFYKGRQDNDGTIFKDTKDSDKSPANRGRQDGVFHNEPRNSRSSKVNRGRQDDVAIFDNEARDSGAGKINLSRQDDDRVIYKEVRGPDRRSVSRGRQDDDRNVRKEARYPERSNVNRSTEDDDEDLYKKAIDPESGKVYQVRQNDDGVIYKGVKGRDSNKLSRITREDDIYNEAKDGDKRIRRETDAVIYNDAKRGDSSGVSQIRGNKRDSVQGPKYTDSSTKVNQIRQDYNKSMNDKEKDREREDEKTTRSLADETISSYGGDEEPRIERFDKTNLLSADDQEAQAEKSVYSEVSFDFPRHTVLHGSLAGIVGDAGDCESRRANVRNLIKQKGEETVTEMNRLLKNYQDRLAYYTELCKSQMAKLKRGDLMDGDIRCCPRRPQEKYPDYRSAQLKKPIVQFGDDMKVQDNHCRQRRRAAPRPISYRHRNIPLRFAPVSYVVNDADQRSFSDGSEPPTPDRNHPNADLFFHNPDSLFSYHRVKKAMEAIEGQASVADIVDHYSKEIDGAVRKLGQVVEEFTNLKDMVQEMLKPKTSSPVLQGSEDEPGPSNRVKSRKNRPQNIGYRRAQYSSDSLSLDGYLKRMQAGANIGNCQPSQYESKCRDQNTLKHYREILLDVQKQFFTEKNEIENIDEHMLQSIKFLKMYKETIRTLGNRNKIVLQKSQLIRENLSDIMEFVEGTRVTGFAKYSSKEATLNESVSSSVSLLCYDLGVDLHIDKLNFDSFPAEGKMNEVIETRMKRLKNEVETVSGQMMYKTMVLNSKYEPKKRIEQEVALAEKEVLALCRKIRALEHRALQVKTAVCGKAKTIYNPFDQFCSKKAIKRIKALQLNLLKVHASAVLKSSLLKAALEAKDRVMKQNDALKRDIDQARQIVQDFEDHIEQFRSTICAEVYQSKDAMSGSQDSLSRPRSSGHRRPAKVVRPPPSRSTSNVTTEEFGSDVDKPRGTCKRRKRPLGIHTAPCSDPCVCASDIPSDAYETQSERTSRELPRTSEVEVEVFSTTHSPIEEAPSTKAIKPPADDHSDKSASVHASRVSSLAQEKKSKQETFGMKVPVVSRDSSLLSPKESTKMFDADVKSGDKTVQPPSRGGISGKVKDSGKKTPIDSRRSKSFTVDLNSDDSQQHIQSSKQHIVTKTRKKPKGFVDHESRKSDISTKKSAPSTASIRTKKSSEITRTAGKRGKEVREEVTKDIGDKISSIKETLRKERRSSDKIEGKQKKKYESDKLKTSSIIVKESKRASATSVGGKSKSVLKTEEGSKGKITSFKRKGTEESVRKSSGGKKVRPEKGISGHDMEQIYHSSSIEIVSEKPAEISLSLKQSSTTAEHRESLTPTKRGKPAQLTKSTETRPDKSYSRTSHESTKSGTEEMPPDETVQVPKDGTGEGPKRKRPSKTIKKDGQLSEIEEKRKSIGSNIDYSTEGLIKSAVLSVVVSQDREKEVKGASDAKKQKITSEAEVLEGIVDDAHDSFKAREVSASIHGIIKTISDEKLPKTEKQMVELSEVDGKPSKDVGVSETPQVKRISDQEKAASHEAGVEFSVDSGRSSKGEVIEKLQDFEVQSKKPDTNIPVDGETFAEGEEMQKQPSGQKEAIRESFKRSLDALEKELQSSGGDRDLIEEHKIPEAVKIADSSKPIVQDSSKTSSGRLVDSPREQQDKISITKTVPSKDIEVTPIQEDLVETLKQPDTEGGETAKIEDSKRAQKQTIDISKATSEQPIDSDKSTSLNHFLDSTSEQQMKSSITKTMLSKDIEVASIREDLDVPVKKPDTKGGETTKIEDSKSAQKQTLDETSKAIPDHPTDSKKSLTKTPSEDKGISIGSEDQQSEHMMHGSSKIDFYQPGDVSGKPKSVRESVDRPPAKDAEVSRAIQDLGITSEKQDTGGSVYEPHSETHEAFKSSDGPLDHPAVAPKKVDSKELSEVKPPDFHEHIVEKGAKRGSTKQSSEQPIDGLQKPKPKGSGDDVILPEEFRKSEHSVSVKKEFFHESSKRTSGSPDVDFEKPKSRRPSDNVGILKGHEQIIDSIDVAKETSLDQPTTILEKPKLGASKEGIFLPEGEKQIADFDNSSKPVSVQPPVVPEKLERIGDEIIPVITEQTVDSTAMKDQTAESPIPTSADEQRVGQEKHKQQFPSIGTDVEASEKHEQTEDPERKGKQIVRESSKITSERPAKKSKTGLEDNKFDGVEESVEGLHRSFSETVTQGATGIPQKSITKLPRDHDESDDLLAEDPNMKQKKPLQESPKIVSKDGSRQTTRPRSPTSGDEEIRETTTSKKPVKDTSRLTTMPEPLASGDEEIPETTISKKPVKDGSQIDSKHASPLTTRPESISGDEETKKTGIAKKPIHDGSKIVSKQASPITSKPESLTEGDEETRKTIIAKKPAQVDSKTMSRQASATSGEKEVLKTAVSKKPVQDRSKIGSQRSPAAAIKPDLQTPGDDQGKKKIVVSNKTKDKSPAGGKASGKGVASKADASDEQEVKAQEYSTSTLHLDIDSLDIPRLQEKLCAEFENKIRDLTSELEALQKAFNEKEDFKAKWQVCLSELDACRKQLMDSQHLSNMNKEKNMTSFLQQQLEKCQEELIHYRCLVKDSQNSSVAVQKPQFVEQSQLRQIIHGQSYTMQYLRQLHCLVRDLLLQLRLLSHKNLALTDRKSSDQSIDEESIRKIICKISKFMRRHEPKADSADAGECFCAYKTRLEKVCAKILQKGIDKLKWDDLAYLHSSVYKAGRAMQGYGICGHREVCRGCGDVPRRAERVGIEVPLEKIMNLENEVTEVKDLIRMLKQDCRYR